VTALLFIISAAGVIALLRGVRRTGRKAWKVAAIVILAIVALAALAYCLLALLLVGGVD
jgi:hypothetical protein